MQSILCKHLMRTHECADCHRKLARRINRDPKVLPLSETVVPFGAHQGKTFDETPLGYLDWLGGQPWVSYGEFAKRLGQYLKHPCIQKELDELFPEEWDDSRKPVFTVQSTYTNREFFKKEERDDFAGPYRVTLMELWERAADYLFLFETADDPNSIFEIDFAELKEICKRIPRARGRLTEAYRAYRSRMRQAKAEPVFEVYVLLRRGIIGYEQVPTNWEDSELCNS